MATTINCPNCGAQNTYNGSGSSTQCAFCRSELPLPAEMLKDANVSKLSSKARTWIILFVVVVIVIPLCAGVGGGLLGFLGTIFSVIVSVFASLFGQ